MKNSIIITCFIALFITHIQAQEQQTLTMPRLRLGVEAGVDFLNGTMNKPPQIRESRSYYSDGDYDFHCGFVLPSYNQSFFYVGVKPEYSLSKRFVVSSGLRFFAYKSVLKSDKDYFLWKISEENLNTNYVKIENISQKNYCVGIPLEIRFFPNEKDYPVRVYFVFGTALNFVVSSKEEVVFANPLMEKYSSDVLSQVGDPIFFHGLLYAGVGLKFGRMGHPFGRIELHIPSLAYGKNDSKNFVDMSSFGVGLQTCLLIPIAKKHQLTYTVTD